MSCVGIEVTIHVPFERAKELKFAPCEGDLYDITRIRTPNVVTTITNMPGTLCFYVGVLPGDYVVSVDGKNWFPLRVLPSPPKQFITLQTGP